MDRKPAKGSIARANRSKKRRFHGNRFTVKEDTSFTSASAAKLSKSSDEEVIISNNYGYCILEFFTVFTAISSLVLCATCKKEIKFSRTAHRGLGFKIALQCSCNESLNSLIWTFAPKHIHAGVHIIEIATFIAVCIFNEGFIPLLKMISLMGMSIGPEAYAFAIRRDNARIKRSEIRTSDASKEARTARLEERNAENTFFEVEEGQMYKAGIAD